MTSDIRKSWLRHWHSVIDDAFGQDPSFDFEAAYKDPYSDFRMHFMTWDLPDEGLRRCFDLLPHGVEMCNRAIEMRRLRQEGIASLSEKEALELFQRGLAGFGHFVERDELEQPVRVTRATRTEMLRPPGDRVATVLEEIDWNVRLARENLEAASFLHETLYRLAHSYDVADYVAWPLYPDPQGIDPFHGFALLAGSDKYFPLLDGDGPVLFVVTDGVAKRSIDPTSREGK